MSAEEFAGDGEGYGEPFHRCNFCGVRDLRAKAKEEGKEVTLRPKTDGTLGGTEIYVHEPGEEIDHDKHWVRWCMEISESCAC